MKEVQCSSNARWTPAFARQRPAQNDIYWQWMIDELARHGYRPSPGPLYPMRHAMEKNGYLSCRRLREGRTVRKLDSATEFGKAGLAVAEIRIRERTGKAMKLETQLKSGMEQKARHRRRSQPLGVVQKNLFGGSIDGLTCPLGRGTVPSTELGMLTPTTLP